jgi:hypothetical protein
VRSRTAGQRSGSQETQDWNKMDRSLMRAHDSTSSGQTMSSCRTILYEGPFQMNNRGAHAGSLLIKDPGPDPYSYLISRKLTLRIGYSFQSL